jgi:hypothetical protein
MPATGDSGHASEETMTRLLRMILLAGLALLALPAGATYHTFQIDEVFSSADGTIQYVVLHESAGMDGQNMLGGKALVATGTGGVPVYYLFPFNLPGGSCGYYGCTPAPTARKHVLIASQGFAALGLLTPDYVMPNGFLPIGGGTLNYAAVDQWTFGALPADGTSALFRDGSTRVNSATNFIGGTVSVTAAAPPPPALNYQGLWWNAGESGWGINFAHQGDRIFATWYTYDTAGKAWWLTMLAQRTTPAGNVYTGTIFVDTGPPFNNFTGAGVPAAVGSGTLTFTDANNGTFAYTVNGVTQNKAIARYDLGTGTQPACTYTAATPDFAGATNYQDIWWAQSGTESGWGINFAHQGDTIFATWFTFDLDGTPLWLSALTARQGATNVYTGAIVRSSGSRFDAFDATKVNGGSVGNATLTFVDGNNASFAYSVMFAPLPGPVNQAKQITRFLFAGTGGTVCR